MKSKRRSRERNDHPVRLLSKKIFQLMVAVAGSAFGQDAVRGQIVNQFQGLMGNEAARAKAHEG